MAELHHFQLVTIVIEPVLADTLLEELTQLGAQGITLTEVRGQGSRHLRAGTAPSDNVKLEVLVTPEVAERIVARVSANYFADYAVLLYVTSAQAVRAEKFV